MSAEATAKPARRTHWVIWAFAAVGLLGLLALIYLAFVLSSMRGHYEPPKVAGAAPETVFTIGNVEELRGTNLVMINISVGGGSGGSDSLSGGGREEVRNIILLDKASGASRKLLPDNKRTILQTRFFSAEGELLDPGDSLMGAEEGGEQAPPAFYVLSVRQPERPDLADILVGTLDSGRQGYVMRGVDGVDSMWMQDPTRIGFVVRDRMKLHYRIADIPSLKVVQSRPIEID